VRFNLLCNLSKANNYSSLLDVPSFFSLDDKILRFPVELLGSCVCLETDIRPSVCPIDVILEKSPVVPPVEVLGTGLHVI